MVSNKSLRQLIQAMNPAHSGYFLFYLNSWQTEMQSQMLDILGLGARTGKHLGFWHGLGKWLEKNICHMWMLQAFYQKIC